MSILEAVFLGVIQGITEFLPVSSSAHLVILRDIFNFDPRQTGLTTIIFLHFASMMAIIVYFFRQIIRLFYQNLIELVYIIIATIPAVIAGLIFKNMIEMVFSSCLFASIFLWITGLFLLIAHIFSPAGQINITQANTARIIIIGTAQAFSLLPGISRSGSTIASGLLCGIKKEDAFRFAFLLGIPAIAGATLFKLTEIVHNKEVVQIMPIILGMTVCFIFSLLSLKFLSVIVQKMKLYIFSIYCFIAGFLTLLWILFSRK